MFLLSLLQYFLYIVRLLHVNCSFILVHVIYSNVLKVLCVLYNEVLHLPIFY